MEQSQESSKEEPKCYHGWDVHQYSPDLLLIWEAWKLEDLHITPDQTKSRSFILQSQMSIEERDALLAKIKIKLSEKYPTKENRKQSEEWKALKKMKSRYLNERGGYEDSVLKSLNIFRLLELTWNTVAENGDESIHALFQETLCDIGQTCPEGDSHRLFLLLNALLNISVLSESNKQLEVQAVPPITQE